MRVVTKGNVSCFLRPEVEVVEVADQRGLRFALRPGDFVLLPASEIGVESELAPVEIDGLRVDRDHVMWRGADLGLSRRERRALYELVRARGAAVHRVDLWLSCWGKLGRARNVDRLMSRLRAKLAPAGFDVMNVRNVGYQLVSNPTSAVLVLEDDPDMQRALSRLLRGLRVDFAASISEAEQMLKGNRYAGVIADLELPDGPITGVLPLVKHMSPEPAVLILSTRTDPDAYALSLRLGVPFATKPADAITLRNFAARAARAQHHLIRTR